MKKYFLPLLLSIIFILAGFKKSASQDMLDLLDSAKSKRSDYTIATFKSTRLINFHTVEVLGKRTLDFRISHRFGYISSGPQNLWGLDGPASLRLGLEYSP